MGGGQVLWLPMTGAPLRLVGLRGATTCGTNSSAAIRDAVAS